MRSEEWEKKNPERRRDQVRRWRAANPEKHREQWTRQRANNPEASREKERRWRAKDIERTREIKLAVERKRRVQKLGSPGTHTAAEIAALLVAQKHRCIYCRADLRKVKRHLDHIQPLAKGGSDDKANLQWLCSVCNTSKNAKDPLVFAREQGLLL